LITDGTGLRNRNVYVVFIVSSYLQLICYGGVEFAYYFERIICWGSVGVGDKITEVSHEELEASYFPAAVEGFIKETF